MHSSISSFERRTVIPGLRQTAADRPGVAQPVPERDIPSRPWKGVAALALLLLAVMVGAWEWHWRAFGSEPSIENSDGLWARARRQIDAGDGRNMVFVGDSRILFDLDLDTWERLSGERPVQLAIEGTSALFVLEDLAKDPHFKGRVLVGLSPQVFFLGFGFRADVVPYFHHETPAQRAGQWLAMHSIDRLFAFYDEDFALGNVLKRQTWWPGRAGMHTVLDVRKLAVTSADRNTQMWRKVELDDRYRDLVRSIWAQRFGPLDAAQQVRLDATIAAQLDRAVAVLATLKARGIEVLFLRPPSGGRYVDYEQRDLPRSKTWDVLLARTGAPGIHFEDYPELGGYEIPEWSHLAAAEKPRFTAALYGIVAGEHGDFLRRPPAP